MKTVILLFILHSFSTANKRTIGYHHRIFRLAGKRLVEWEPVASAESYNVYYSGNGVVNQKIDDQLIRSYGTYFRADILGLKAGGYTVRLHP